MTNAITVEQQNNQNEAAFVADCRRIVVMELAGTPELHQLAGEYFDSRLVEMAINDYRESTKTIENGERVPWIEYWPGDNVCKVKPTGIDWVQGCRWDEVNYVCGWKAFCLQRGVELSL